METIILPKSDCNIDGKNLTVSETAKLFNIYIAKYFNVIEEHETYYVLEEKAL